MIDIEILVFPGCQMVFVKYFFVCLLEEIKSLCIKPTLKFFKNLALF